MSPQRPRDERGAKEALNGANVLECAAFGYKFRIPFSGFPVVSAQEGRDTADVEPTLSRAGGRMGGIRRGAFRGRFYRVGAVQNI